jgi:riboflavin synthase
VLAGAETLAKTTLGERRVGDKLHLERALALGARLGGHLVAGHVDGVGELVSADRSAAPTWCFTYRPPRALLRYVIVKGSIAIDGVSLTVNAVDDDAGPSRWRSSRTPSAPPTSACGGRAPA